MRNKVVKGAGCCSPEMKKPNLRILFSLNWSPRKKAESYLMRKIRRLREAGGMTSTLDETLGDSNPHYPRVMREKFAARNAARRAMEARKAAMVEAYWSRILRTARIQSEEAEALLQQAEKSLAEAFEAATGLGVVMYDRPYCLRKPCEVESSSINAGSTTTHTVTTCFETAFEVDVEVAYAVKTALILLADSVYNFSGSAVSCEDIAELHVFYNVSHEVGKQSGKENIDSNSVHRVEMENMTVCSEDEKKKIRGIDHVQECTGSLDGASI